MSVDGRYELARQLNTLQTVPDAAAVQGVSWAIKLVEASAKLQCPVGDSELRGSITSVVESEQDVVRGTCYTNKSYGPYVELGTGPKGQRSHEGISPEVNPAYTQTPWWIHESQIDKATAEKYKMFFIETKNGIFYRSSGQAAQPFMYPALKNNEDAAMEKMQEGWTAAMSKRGLRC